MIKISRIQLDFCKQEEDAIKCFFYEIRDTRVFWRKLDEYFANQANQRNHYISREQEKKYSYSAVINLIKPSIELFITEFRH